MLNTIEKWMRAIPLLAIAFGMLGCNGSSAQPGGDLPSGFTQKTPSLPTTFLDTTGQTYAWHKSYNRVQSIQNRIPPPDGFKRDPAPKTSFATWLRGLPLKPGRPDVLLYNGESKRYQGAQYAVIDMDVGKKDLQQCADAVMRLRAEYLFSQKAFSKIHFNFTSGDNCDWERWRKGIRPKISGNSVTWSPSAASSDGYPTFKKYMEMVFNYAGTSSLSKELEKVNAVKEIECGDVFIQGGFPGHAIMVVDVAVHPESGEKVFLLAQSYMPAQEMHVLINPANQSLSPWYSADFSGQITTPEWSFEDRDLKRFQD